MNRAFWSRLKELREENELTQQQLSELLGVSRATLAQIETWVRKVKTEEVVKLSEIFDVPASALLSWEEPKELKIKKKQKERFKQLMLYILTKVWSKYNVWKTVLYKLLYFSEFDYFELTGEKLSGYPFIRLPMWPAPYEFNELIDEMKAKDQIATVTTKMIDYYQQRFIPIVEVKNRFSDAEKKSINDVLERYSDLKASKISEISHEDKPRQMTKDMQLIAYDLVKYREYPYSPLARADAKDKAMHFASTTSFFDDLADEPDLYEDYR